MSQGHRILNTRNLVIICCARQSNVTDMGTRVELSHSSQRENVPLALTHPWGIPSPMERGGWRHAWPALPAQYHPDRWMTPATQLFWEQEERHTAKKAHGSRTLKCDGTQTPRREQTKQIHTCHQRRCLFPIWLGHSDDRILCNNGKVLWLFPWFYQLGMLTRKI